MSGSLFSATEEQHVELIAREALVMARLLRLYHCAAVTCGALWAAHPAAARARGQPDRFSGYIPFRTSSTVA